MYLGCNINKWNVHVWRKQGQDKLRVKYSVPVPNSLFASLRFHRICYVKVDWYYLETSWNVMAHGIAREGKWKGNWRMEWVASTLHNTSEHGVSSITTADAHNSATSSRLNWGPRRFKWTRPFRRKTKSGFCACAIIFQTQSTYQWSCL